MDDGVVIRIRRYGDPARPVRLFISHGNGFAVDGYLPFWGPLRERFELVLFDCRNHGRNPTAGADPHGYARIGRDIERIREAVTARLGPKTSVGAFHSMSASAALRDVMEGGSRWDALVLFDPPICPPPSHPVFEAMRRHSMALAKWSMRRRDRFPDPGVLAGDYAQSRAFANWVEGAHDLMARAVLRPDEATGEWVSICPPRLESEMYSSAVELDQWPDYEPLRGRIKLVGADPDLKGATMTAVMNRVLHEECGFPYEAIPGTDHMMQISKPAECIRVLTSFIEECGIAT